MSVSRTRLISSAEEWEQLGYDLSQIKDRDEPQSVLMCQPTFFTVNDVKNPFMDGNSNKVDAAVALQQWRELRTTFEGLGCTVRLIPPQADLEDMVFTANQTLPGKDASGVRYVILSEMRHESRRREVSHFADWFGTSGYKLIQFDGEPTARPRFEGQGDAIWHPGKNLLWGGYGFRSEKLAYMQLSQLIDATILTVELINERFYHLDTAFCPLSTKSVLLYPPAFSPESLALINKVFSDVIEVSDEDANNFACNSLAIDNAVVIQSGSPTVCSHLEQRGFTVFEVETGEFMKSGGSVFCLKQQIY